MIKVLVVEDNQPLAKSLGDWLRNDYEVTAVGTGRAAFKAIGKQNYGLVILDLGLPDMTGQDVCHTVRQNGFKAPILVLTGTDEVSSKVNLLDIGADDYLLKPFFVGELKARIRALLRRGGEKSVHINLLKVADLELNPASRMVTRAGKTIELRRKEFDILEYLMRNRDTVVTRAMIIANAWEAGSDRWNNTVDVHIKYLRDKIDRPFSRQLIKTAYGVGYMISAD